jgi:Fe-S oxidoreductase
MSRSIIFTIIFFSGCVFSAWAVYKRFRLVSAGKPDSRVFPFFKRIVAMFVYAFGQLRVISRPVGFIHFIIFWSFILLGLSNSEFIVNGIFPGISLALLPSTLHHFLLFSFDIISLLAMLAVSVAALRRLLFKPAYMDSRYVMARNPEAFFILGMIFLLMTAYFGMEGVKIIQGLEDGTKMPVSNIMAGLIKTIFHGDVNTAIPVLGSVFWWLHAVILVTFICYIPASKHMHIFTAIPNCFMRSLEKPLMLQREDFKPENTFGAGRVDQFTWKDLFDPFSCTECGRCQDVCPADATGKSLNPRQIIHSIKVNLLKNGEALRNKKELPLPLINGENEGTNTEAAIWACTTCGACLEACPVWIEQMPKIIKMRRHLVEMEAKFPDELLNLFENMEARSNPWGMAPGDRAKWCSTMSIAPFEAGKTEYLFYVGCAGSFDSRQKHVTVAMAYILDQAKVSYGILGRDEKCCGDSLRRLGNEFVFEKMALENVKIFKERGVKKIITQCPHCFSTLKNDYKQYGLEIEVIHHSELINDLIKSGRLKPEHEVKNFGKIVFHDSCYLGRHNNIYEQPREVVLKATASPVLEMKKNRKNSFCCGAGGGRMWMEEHEGRRINLERTSQALSTGADTVCVSCPYCLTMFEDGLKDKKITDKKVVDVAEIVAESLRKHS